MATQSKRNVIESQEQEVDTISDWKDFLTCSFPNRCLIKFILASALIIFLIGVSSLSLYLTNYYGLWNWRGQVRKSNVTTVKPKATTIATDTPSSIAPVQPTQPPTPLYNPVIVYDVATMDNNNFVLACPAVNQWIDIYNATLEPLRDETGCIKTDRFVITKSVYRDCSEQANQPTFKTCKIAMNFTRMEVVKNECQPNRYLITDLMVKVFYRCVDYELVMNQGIQLNKTTQYTNEALLNCGPYYVNIVSAIFDDTSTPNCAAIKDITSDVKSSCFDQIQTPIATDKYILNTNLLPRDQRCVIGPNWYESTIAACKDKSLTIKYKCVKDKPT